MRGEVLGTKGFDGRSMATTEAVIAGTEAKDRTTWDRPSGSSLDHLIGTWTNDEVAQMEQALEEFKGTVCPARSRAGVHRRLRG